MKLTKEFLTKLIKEELEKEAYNPRTYDDSGEYAGRGPAGIDSIENVPNENEEVRRLRSAIKMRMGNEKIKAALELAEKTVFDPSWMASASRIAARLQLEDLLEYVLRFPVTNK